MAGLYEPEAGRVLYDEADLRDLEVGSLRRQLGIVTQESFVFGTSIQDNIALAGRDLSQHDVARAARLACIDEDIQAMAMGYATVLVEGGASLSGGQRQRLVLARALASRRRCFSWTRPPARWNTVTEAAVYQNLASLNSTVIVIAHRLSTITRADMIVVIDRGNSSSKEPTMSCLPSAGTTRSWSAGRSVPAPR